MSNTDDTLEEILKAYKRYPYGTKELPHITGDEAKALLIAWRDKAMLRARIEENQKVLKTVPALDKHSGASWYRGYVSAQQTLRQKVKKRIAQLQARKEKRK